MEHAAVDLYPSRYPGMKETVVSRPDPVVYRAADAIKEYACPVSRVQIDAYERSGFMLLERVFSIDEVAMFAAELNRLRKDDGIRQQEAAITEMGNGTVRSVFSAHTLSPVFARLASDPRLVMLARHILADAVYIHQSRINYKPGLHGRDFYWHSDFETWHVEDGLPRMRTLSMSVALTDNDAFNGPLLLMPGSHRQFVGCEGETPENNYRHSLKKQQYGVPSDAWLEKAGRHYGLAMASVKAGSVIVFDCNMMHGSNGNITPFPRSNAFFVYNAISNRPKRPYCHRPPRPEYIATRQRITAITLPGESGEAGHAA